MATELRAHRGEKSVRCYRHICTSSTFGASNKHGVDRLLYVGGPRHSSATLPARKHALRVLGAMFRTLADSASVPVVAHLDHGYEAEECREAIDCGFTSVMFDGSRKPVAQNIEETAAIAEMAHAAGASCEGEIGFVGYAEGEASARTDPDDAARFAGQTDVDAMAVSLGNVHLQLTKAAEIDLDALAAIEAVTDVPLVLHGGSGIPVEMRRHLAKNSHVCKFNIGTELRMAFGAALRDAVNSDPSRFDRVSILKETEAPVCEATRDVLRALNG